MPALRFAAAYQRSFRVVPANTPALRDVCFRLRHAVYCQEFAFEPVERNGREDDEWDNESIHCLVQSATTGEYSGCARLIIAPSHDPRREFPFERVCKLAIDRTIVDPWALPRESIAEVSRLAVLPDFRGFGPAPMQSIPAAELKRAVSDCVAPSMPYILTGLVLGLLALAHLHSIDLAFMVLDQRLVRRLGGLLGIRPRIIGHSVDWHGARVPALLSVRETLDRLRELLQPLFNAIWADIRDALLPASAGTSARHLTTPLLPTFPQVGVGTM